jgi:outer membrane protein OmpA-like peptidoglycan-associated protein
MADRVTQTETQQNRQRAAKVDRSSESAKRPTALWENRVREWQSTLGNQGMQRSLLDGAPGISRLRDKSAASSERYGMLNSVFLQMKLAINKPGDVFEQEADRIADAVMSSRIVGEAGQAAASGTIGNGKVQRACKCGGACDDCRQKEDLVQRLSVGPTRNAGSAPQIVDDVLRSPGHALDNKTRGFMESRFGADFGGVRVHTDAKAAESAHKVDARAYTVRRDIVFGSGEYQPHTDSGRKILAHELSHTLQQGATKGERALSENQGGTLQRACHPSGIGNPECPESDDTHQFVDGLLFPFKLNCDDPDKGADEQLSNLAKALKPDSRIAIHGYASVDGPKDFNERLSCARALKAKSILTAGGIPESSITNVVSHGPTPGPAEKRRSVTLVIVGPSPKNDPAEPRDVPSKVDVKTTHPGEDPPSGPAKMPQVTVDPVVVDPKKPDDSTKQTTPEPPSHLVEFGGEINVKTKHLFKGTPDPGLSPFCRNVEVEGQLNAKLKLDGFGVGERLKLFYHEPQFSLSFFPAQCNKASEAKLELDVVNLEVVPKILEFALKPGLTLEGSELKPGTTFSAEFKPWGKNNNFLGHLKITGELEIKRENAPGTSTKETTVEGSLGVGAEF